MADLPLLWLFLQSSCRRIACREERLDSGLLSGGWAALRAAELCLRGEQPGHSHLQRASGPALLQEPQLGKFTRPTTWESPRSRLLSLACPVLQTEQLPSSFARALLTLKGSSPFPWQELALSQLSQPARYLQAVTMFYGLKSEN